MRFLKLMLVAFTIGFWTNSNAAELPVVKPIITLGMPDTCGAWVHEREIKSPLNSYYEGWMLGFMSGVAQMSGTDFLKVTDNKSIYLWMDNYCKSHPLKNVVSGASDLTLELIKKMH